MKLTIAKLSRRPGGVGGFTLIELVAIIVVTAVLAVVAAPTLSGSTSARRTAAAKQVLRDLCFARQRAISSGAPSWVVFDTAGESYEVLVESHTTPGRASATALTDPATGRDMDQVLNQDQFAGVEILTASFDGDDEVGFDWLGRPLDSGEGTLGADGTVTLTGGHTITVETGTGYVSHTAP
jgi:MSHA pilin protein MshC